MDPPCVEVSRTGKGNVEKARGGRAGHGEGAAWLFGRPEDEGDGHAVGRDRRGGRKRGGGLGGCCALGDRSAGVPCRGSAWRKRPECVFGGRGRPLEMWRGHEGCRDLVDRRLWAGLALCWDLGTSWWSWGCCSGVVTEGLGWRGVACVHRWARGLSRTAKLEWKDREDTLKGLSTGVPGDTVSSFSEANVSTAVLVEEPMLELGGGNPTMPRSSDITAIGPTKCSSEMEWEAVLTPWARQSPHVVHRMH